MRGHAVLSGERLIKARLGQAFQCLARLAVCYKEEVNEEETKI
jgi:hypothetical protein